VLLAGLHPLSESFICIPFCRLAKKESADYTDVPLSLRPYWDTVFLDDVAYAEHDGGGRAYQSLVVGPEGCVVLVRPDGHVAALAPLDDIEGLKKILFPATTSRN
jgi:hypothetical protein